MRKYFFSYHSVMGNPFPMMWVEENGICVGGRPLHLLGKKVEISCEIFNKGELSPLEKEYPAYTVKGLISISEVEESEEV